MNLNTEGFKRSELLWKYTAKILFGWDDRKFEDDLFKETREKLDKVKEEEVGLSFSRGEILKRRVIS